MSQWSHEWKLNLNASKSEVAYFSTWTKEPEWNAEIKIDGEPIAFTHTPRLLGVTMDRQLTFGEHVKNVSKAATGACRMLSALANSNFGWRKQYLVRVYRCMIMSKMDYAGPAWQGNIADCHKLTLERSQNRALRLITGQFADSPLESLRAETGIPSFDTHIKRNLLISKEKALRLDDSHPRRRAAEDSITKRGRTDEQLKAQLGLHYRSTHVLLQPGDPRNLAQASHVLSSSTMARRNATLRLPRAPRSQMQR